MKRFLTIVGSATLTTLIYNNFFENDSVHLKYVAKNI